MKPKLSKCTVVLTQIAPGQYVVTSFVKIQKEPGQAFTLRRKDRLKHL